MWFLKHGIMLFTVTSFWALASDGNLTGQTLSTGRKLLMGWRATIQM